MEPREHKGEQARFRGRVLVAEDVRANQILMKSLLGKLGLEVAIAEDGREAVQKAPSGGFDVIFMDLRMPNMDGYEATRTLREKGTTIPIIALTGCTEEQDRTKCFDAGCDDYLPKPIDRLCLVEKLGKYVPSRDTPPDTGVSTEPPARGSDQGLPDGCQTHNDSGNVACVIDAQPIIDWDALVRRGFDETLAASVMTVCMEDNRKRLQQLTSAVRADNDEDVTSCAHAMKGSFGMVGAAQLAQIASCLEERARQHDLSEAEHLLASMETGFQELQLFVSKPDWVELAKKQAEPMSTPPTKTALSFTRSSWDRG